MQNRPATNRVLPYPSKRGFSPAANCSRQSTDPASRQKGNTNNNRGRSGFSGGFIVDLLVFLLEKARPAEPL